MDKKTKLILIGGLVLIFFPLIFVWYQKRKIEMAITEKENFYKYDDLFKFYAKGYPWKWLKAIAMQESSLGQNERVKKGLTSYDGKSYGLMQIAEGIGSPEEIRLKGFGGKERLNDPAYSIRIAASLVSCLNKKYGGNETLVFLGYNQGETNTDKGKDYTKKYNGGISYAEKIKDKLLIIEQKNKEYGK